MKLAIFSIAPSPYQRDLFSSIAQCSGIELEVFYWERDTGDSPWTVDSLFPHEHILNSHEISVFKKRIHWSRNLPNPASFDLILLNGYMNFGILGYIYKIPQEVPIVFFGESFSEGGNIAQRIFRRVSRVPLARISAAIAIGSRAQKQYHHIFPGKPVINQPYVIDTVEFDHGKVASKSGPVNILFCGQLIHRKGIDVLLHAFETLLASEDIPSLKLILVGRAENYNDLTRHLSNTTIEQIEYLGFLEPDTLGPIFRSADIFVLPSRYDGWGVVVNQAIAAGLPIISTTEVGAAKDLVNEHNGIVIEPGDTEGLYHALKRIIEMRASWHTIAEYNKKLSKTLTPDFAAKKITHFLKEQLRAR